MATRQPDESALVAPASPALHWRGAVQLRYRTPILDVGGRRIAQPAPRQVSIASNASQGLTAVSEALRRRLGRRMPETLPFFILPFFALMSVLTAWELGALAVLSLLAPIAFFAGYAALTAGRGERNAARRLRRIEADARRRLEDIDPTDSMFSLNYFEARLDQEIRRCRRHEIPLCVLTLKLPSGADGWSSEAAHLVSIASRLLRAEDSICHMGDNGYAISLPHTTPAGAAVVISRLAQELRDNSPEFGLAYLPPGRLIGSPALIEHALRTPVKAETAEAAASGVAAREPEAA